MSDDIQSWIDYKHQNSVKCDGCGNEIDPDYCHCGNTPEDHGTYEGHRFVPMGCDCLRSTPSGGAK